MAIRFFPSSSLGGLNGFTQPGIPASTTRVRTHSTRSALSPTSSPLFPSSPCTDTPGASNVGGVRGRITVTLIVALLSAGCGHTGPRGVVDGSFSLPGRPAADLQRGGLNFSANEHGNGNGHTTRVDADGTYSVTLPPGSYSVIGGLSGHPGGPAAETCGATINVVVKAKSTTRADYVCDSTPATSPTP
jgi:hypothetical protein